MLSEDISWRGEEGITKGMTSPSCEYLNRSYALVVYVPILQMGDGNLTLESRYSLICKCCKVAFGMILNMSDIGYSSSPQSQRGRG